MSDYGLDKRLREIANTHEKYPLTFPIALIILVVGILLGIGFSQIDGFGGGFYTEIVSIIITVGIIDVINQWRRKQEEDKIQRLLNENYGRLYESPESHKRFGEMVIRDLLSGYRIHRFDISNFHANRMKLIKTYIEAFNMRESNWVQTLFTQTTFRGCDMRRSVFRACNFENSRLAYCDLGATDISDSTLRNAQISNCMFDGSHFTRINLSKANLSQTSLRGCQIIACDLRGTNLTECDLESCHLGLVKCDSCTILPDGSRYDVTQGLEQFARFCNPKHPQFVKSPIGGLSLAGLDVPNYL